MCRLVGYLGEPILLESILVKPVNSLVMQSLHARESSVPTNGDGFGVGWYAPQLSPNPGLFVSIFPAWSDRNLIHLTAKIKSQCFFAHVRAASVGGTNSYNCHPFSYDKWMLMHNGDIHQFSRIKRHLRHLLDDTIYNSIQGETDSEHFFALFLQLSQGQDFTNLTKVADIFEQTLRTVERLSQQYTDATNPSYFNVCITDGKRLLASRYCSDKNTAPESLHYLDNGNFNDSLNIKGVVIASEELTDVSNRWQIIPANHLILVDEDLSITFRGL